MVLNIVSSKNSGNLVVLALALLNTFVWCDVSFNIIQKIPLKVQKYLTFFLHLAIDFK